MQNYALRRESITPDTRLSDILPVAEIGEGWPWLHIIIGLEVPDFQVSKEILGFKMPPRVLTIKQLVRQLIELNIKKLPPEREGEDEKIWDRLVDVFLRQLNVNRDEVVPEASMTGDLGAD